MANVSEIKRGQVIRWKNGLWSIVQFQHVSPGKGSAFTRIKLKDLQTGKVVENTFKATETLEFADVQRKNMQFLFSDGTTFTFMDTRTYDQVAIDAETIGTDAAYLKESLEVNVAMLDERAVTIQLPPKIEYVVTQTEPAVKGDTASGNVTKEATMDNGLSVRVPIFINEGDHILVSTDSCTYVERVNK